jgi:drug/metabolite transporter (DMT)-like permease|tara:strand:+ start:23687 stop:24541 length:855 start_codon:yes stop_codon:yes gene_type:complete
LYLSTILIWGSTWLAITFQLGEVDPLVSVIYRMTIGSALLFLWCLVRKISLKVNLVNHAFFLAQGGLLFGLNFWTIYLAEVYLTSGIVAVIFSLLIFFNIINGRIFLNRPVSAKTLLGGFMGMVGVGMLFYPEIIKYSSSENALFGFSMAVLSVLIASLGNITATRNGHTGLSIWSINAWAMLYGSLILTVIALLKGVNFTYEYSFEYSASLIYLSVFGTVLVFGAYMKLLISIGPDRAAFTSLIIPFVAIALSTIYEDYQWTAIAVVGFLLVIAGNFFVVIKR